MRSELLLGVRRDTRFGVLLLVPCLVGLIGQAVRAQIPLADSVILRRTRILAAPTLSSAPETGLTFGGVAFINSDLYGDGTRPATGKLQLSLSLQQQLVLQADWAQFTRGEAWLVDLRFDLLRFPEDIYARGPRAPDSTVESYDAWRLEAAGRVLRKVASNLFVGGTANVQYVWAVRPALGGLLERGAYTGGRGGWSVGLGPALVWDLRRNVLNPNRGAYVLAQSQWYRQAWGSNFRFSQHELDVRKYLTTHTVRSLNRPAVLALQARTIVQDGDPPFRMLALLGSSRDMRGYYRGRYRDRAYYTLQAEYRLPVYGRAGLVAFAGVGDVAPEVSQISTSTLKPSYGLGGRFEIDRQRRVNLRLDAAWGEDSVQLYFGFGEAF